jgi:hypothetical protein
MATQSSGSGEATSSASRISSAQVKATMPTHRFQAPAGCGKGIEFTDAAQPQPDEVPHLRHLSNTTRAWISNGEMLIVRPS